MSQRVVMSLMLAATAATTYAQQPASGTRPPVSQSAAAGSMTNQDVTTLTKTGMKDDALVARIAVAAPPKFDLSPDALMALKVAGVSDAVITAMMQAQEAGGPSPDAPNGSPGPAVTAATVGPPAGPVPDIQSGQFRAFMTIDGTRLEMPVAQSKVAPVADAKGNDLTSLAVDNAVGSMLNGSAAIAALSPDTAGASSTLGGVGGAIMQTSTVQSALGGLTHLFGKKTTTYLWAVPRRQSPTQTSAARPVVRVGFDDIPGVDPTQFEPVLVHLQVTPDNWRIVGAAKSDSDPLQQQTWQVYTKFIQDIVVTTTQPVARGLVDLTPAADLPPGEYAIVLRPLDAKKKFVSGQFQDDSGEVRLFNAVFDFSVIAGR